MIMLRQVDDCLGESYGGWGCLASRDHSASGRPLRYMLTGGWLGVAV